MFLRVGTAGPVTGIILLMGLADAEFAAVPYPSGLTLVFKSGVVGGLLITFLLPADAAVVLVFKAMSILSPCHAPPRALV